MRNLLRKTRWAIGKLIVRMLGLTIIECDLRQQVRVDLYPGEWVALYAGLVKENVIVGPGRDPGGARA